MNRIDSINEGFHKKSNDIVEAASGDYFMAASGRLPNLTETDTPPGGQFSWCISFLFMAVNLNHEQ